MDGQSVKTTERGGIRGFDAHKRVKGRNRRLSKDYEYSVQTSETLIDIAATRLILNRLASA